MKICELRLRNVKSYADEVIRFQDGVNFISGVNGAGKTTIIESVGFVLFDYLPYNIKQFIRDGERSGEIQLLLEATDERQYRILRKFNRHTKSVKWEVWDEESGAVLDQLHGSKDVSQWIKEQIGVDSEDRLDQLFQQVIAVDQGLFTAPFLDTPAARKKMFEKILKVEGYREAYQNSRSLITYLTGEAERSRFEADLIAQELEQLPHVEQELKSCLTQMEEQQQVLSAQQTAYEQQSTQEVQWTEIKQNIEHHIQKDQLRQQQIQSLQEQIERVEREKKEAQFAAQIVQDSEAGFQRYIQNREQLKQLEEQKQEKDRLQQKADELERHYGTEKKAIEVEQAHLEQVKIKMYKQMEEYTSRQQQAQEQFQLRKAQHEQVTAFQGIVQDMHTGLRPVLTRLQEHEPIMEDMRRMVVQLRECQEEKEQLIVELQYVRDWQREMDSLANIPHDMEQVLEQKSALKARQDVLFRNQQELAGGRCPIIQEPCPSHKVSGDLDGFFQEQIKQIEEESGRLDNRLELIREGQARMQKLNELLHKASVQQSRLKSLHMKEDQLLADVHQHTRQIPFEQLKMDWLWMQEKKQEMKHHVQHFENWLQEEGLEVSTLEVDLTRNVLAATEQKAASPMFDTDMTVYDAMGVQRLLQYWDQLTAKMEQKHAELEEGLQYFGHWLAECQQHLKAEGQRLLQEKRQYEQHKIDLKQECEQNSQKEVSLQQRKEQLEKLARQMRDRQNDIQQYAFVEQKVQQLKQKTSEDLPDYERYQQHQRAAQQFSQVQEQWKHLDEQVRKVRREQAQIRVTLSQLNDQYDQDQHERLKKSILDLHGQIETGKYALGTLQRDKNRLEQEYQALQDKRKVYEDRHKQWRIRQKTLEMARLIREVIKQAADPIAQVYRQHLSAQAN